MRCYDWVKSGNFPWMTRLFDGLHKRYSPPEHVILCLWTFCRVTTFPFYCISFRNYMLSPNYSFSVTFFSSGSSKIVLCRWLFMKLSNTVCLLVVGAAERLQEQAMNLALKCLSFDFVGTSFDESSEELGAIQVCSRLIYNRCAFYWKWDRDACSCAVSG